MLGVPFEERGARTDEATALLRRLWADDFVTFHGRFISVDDAAVFPKPVQRPHPPIWVGGDSPAALRRVARLGDGWMAVPRDLEYLTRCIQTLRTEMAAAGRDPASIGVASGGGARSMDELLRLLPRLATLGVTIVNVPALFWSRSVAEAIEVLERFAERVGLSATQTTTEV
jgi:hypothetical protein